MVSGVGRGQKKATDEQLIEKYKKLGSVWAVAGVFGMCGQSVHERLSRLGVIEFNRVDEAELLKIKSFYEKGFKSGDGELDRLCSELKRTKAFISRLARMMGLTNYKRKRSDVVSSQISDRLKKWHKNNEHPRGAFGMKHTESARKRISDVNRKSWENKTDEEKKHQNNGRNKSKRKKRAFISRKNKNNVASRVEGYRRKKRILQKPVGSELCPLSRMAKK
jgi:hypothetical protein